MALSDQSELPMFFSPRQVNLKISYCILPNPTIPEDDLPRLAKSRLTTSRNWPGLGTSITVIWCHRQVNLQSHKGGFDETSSLKPSSGDKRFRSESIGIFTLTFRGLRNAYMSLRLDNAIPEILQPH
jgi:hypothetical protein